KMKRIKVYEMDRTVSADEVDRFYLKDYEICIYTGEDYIKAIPELNEIADVSFESFLKVSSTKINAAHWVHLRNKATKCLCEEENDGIVITDGTNTLEE